MWAKNSTPSPGFLEESLAQNTIPRREWIKGKTLVILALSSVPFPPTCIGSEQQGLCLVRAGPALKKSSDLNV